MIEIYPYAPVNKSIDTVRYGTIPRGEWIRREAKNMRKHGRKTRIIRKEGKSKLVVSGIVPHPGPEEE